MRLNHKSLNGRGKTGNSLPLPPSLPSQSPQQTFSACVEPPSLPKAIKLFLGPLLPFYLLVPSLLPSLPPLLPLLPTYLPHEPVQHEHLHCLPIRWTKGWYDLSGHRQSINEGLLQLHDAISVICLLIFTKNRLSSSPNSFTHEFCRSPDSTLSFVQKVWRDRVAQSRNTCKKSDELGDLGGLSSS